MSETKEIPIGKHDVATQIVKVIANLEFDRHRALEELTEVRSRVNILEGELSELGQANSGTFADLILELCKARPECCKTEGALESLRHVIAERDHWKKQSESWREDEAAWQDWSRKLLIDRDLLDPCGNWADVSARTIIGNVFKGRDPMDGVESKTGGGDG